MSNRAGICIISIMCISMWAPTIGLAEEQSNAPLSAEQQAKSDSLINDGVQHYSKREYEEAIESFKAALEIRNEPELLYNIARSYERLVRSEEALKWYERLLDTPGTTGELRTKALNNIAMLHKELDAKKNAEEAAQGDRGGKNSEFHTDSDMRDSKDSMTSDSSVNKMDSEDSKQKKKMSPLELSGWIATGVGAAGVITGSIFGAMAIKKSNDYEAAGRDPDRLEYRDDVKRNALIFDIVFPISGVAVAAGVTLLVVNGLKSKSGNESDGNTQSFRILPSVGIDQHSLSCGFTGRF